jgi:hypothetical protein
MNPLRGCLCDEKWNFRVHAQEDRFVEDKETWRRSINSPVRRCLCISLDQPALLPQELGATRCTINGRSLSLSNHSRGTGNGL